MKPAAGYHAGDLILTRFYSYLPGQPGVYTPGPVELMWATEFTVGSVCGSIDDGNPCTVDANGPSGPTHTPRRQRNRLQRRQRLHAIGHLPERRLHGRKPSRVHRSRRVSRRGYMQLNDRGLLESRKAKRRFL